MTISITHSTPADSSFSASGAAAWDATHSFSGVLPIAYGGTNANLTAVAGGAVGDLAEVAPHPAVQVQVLLNQRHHADGEVTSNTATDLEESNTLAIAVFHIPIGKPNHIFNSTLHG